LWNAVKNSLIVATGTVFLSLAMGSLLVFFGMRGRQHMLPLLFYANLGMPEIMIAVGLLGMFSYLTVPLSLVTLVMCHTVLGLGYVVPLIYIRFEDLDKRYIEASLDLGATQLQTFFKIVLPLLSPALLSAGLLVFIVSFDDFVLSFFCAGATAQTLPLYIFSMLRAGSAPVVSALSTILIMISSILVLTYLYLQTDKGGM
jgi:spermidine/putrescine transport system permease protein